MSYGFKTISANGVPLFNTEGINVFIHSIEEFYSPAINKKYIHFPNYGLEGDTYYNSSYVHVKTELRSCIEPYYMVSLPVGGKLYDQWGEEASIPTSTSSNNYNSVPLHAGSTLVSLMGTYSSSAVRLSLNSTTGSTRIAVLHCVEQLAEFGNTSLNTNVFPKKGYGLHIFDKYGNLQWTDEVQVGKFDTITKSFQGVSWEGGSSTISVFASRELKAGEDFFVTLKPLGMTFGYKNQTVSLTRVAANRYDITREPIDSLNYLGLRQVTWDVTYGFNLDIATAILKV